MAPALSSYENGEMDRRWKTYKEDADINRGFNKVARGTSCLWSIQ
jgi:hypothetical protein